MWVWWRVLYAQFQYKGIWGFPSAASMSGSLLLVDVWACPKMQARPRVSGSRLALYRHTRKHRRDALLGRNGWGSEVACYDHVIRQQ
jgi:hypothetical protein